MYRDRTLAMNARREKQLKRTDIVAAFLALVLVVISFLSASWLPVHLFNWLGGDKFAHIFAYAILGVFALYARKRFGTAFLTALSLLYLSGVVELIQAELGRSTDVMDLAANGIGLAISGTIVTAWKLSLPAATPRPRRT